MRRWVGPLCPYLVTSGRITCQTKRHELTDAYSERKLGPLSSGYAERSNSRTLNCHSQSCLLLRFADDTYTESYINLLRGTLRPIERLYSGALVRPLSRFEEVGYNSVDFSAERSNSRLLNCYSLTCLLLRFADDTYTDSYISGRSSGCVQRRRYVRVEIRCGQFAQSSFCTACSIVKLFRSYE